MIDILLVINLGLLAYILYAIVGLYQRVHDLEDHVHAIHHDIDMKIEEVKDGKAV